MACSSCGSSRKKIDVRVFREFDAYGPKKILLQNIPARKCEVCGKETISIEDANKGVVFLKRVGNGLEKTEEKDGILIAQFPE